MKKTILLLVLLVCAAYLLPLGVREMFSPDETRYGEIGREMLVSGNSVVPYLNGVKYFEKPILGYWLFAASEKIFGLNAFAVRFPCAAATLLTAWMLFLFVRKHSPDQRDAVLAGFLYLLTPLVFGLGTAATLDPILSMFLTAGMILFHCSLKERVLRKKILLQLLCGGVFGAAFLTKGFLAFVLPGVAIAAYLLWNRRWKDLLIQEWLPLAGALIVLLPWSLMIAQQEPEFWRYFIMEEHLKRFLEKEQHPQPFWFFIPVLLGGLGYFLLYLPAALKNYTKKIWSDDFFRYNFCWFVMPFIFLSFSSGKLATYILPCFAPLAVMLAAGIRRTLLEKQDVKWFDLITKILAVLLAAASFISVLLQLSPFPWRPYAPAELWKWISAAAGVLCCAGLFLRAIYQKIPGKKLVLFASGIAVIFLILPFAVPNLLNDQKSACALLEKVRPELADDAIVLSFRYPFQDVCWTLRRQDVLMYCSGGELDKGIEFMKWKEKILTKQETIDLIRSRGKRQVLFVTGKKVWMEDKAEFPPPSKYWFCSELKNKGYAAVLYHPLNNLK